MLTAPWFLDIVLLITTNIDLQVLAREGKEFKWEKPRLCPRCCGHSIWGHGFVGAYFDGFKAMIYLKRYRCQNCRCTMTLKPQGYWKKFQSNIEVIFTTLSYRLALRRWAVGINRQRAGHWLRRFIRKIRMDFGFNNDDQDLLTRLNSLFRLEIFFLG